MNAAILSGTLINKTGADIAKFVQALMDQKYDMKAKEYVLITGGTMGIGYELARLFAKDGYNLVLVARHSDDLEKTGNLLEKEFGVDVLQIKKDLFDVNQALELYEETKRLGIHISILVNNAGQGEYGKFKDTDLDKELSIIRLNISSMVALTKLYLINMLEKGEGKILNLSSIAGKAPGPWHSVYHGTKAFIQSFTEALHYELKDEGIVVTALLPGATDTDFFRKAHMKESKIAQEEELADPADVAKDGYDALMEGKDMVVSGFKNKMQVMMGKLKSDQQSAKKMAKDQEPVDSEEEAAEE